MIGQRVSYTSRQTTMEAHSTAAIPTENPEARGNPITEGAEISVTTMAPNTSSTQVASEDATAPNTSSTQVASEDAPAPNTSSTQVASEDAPAIPVTNSEPRNNRITGGYVQSGSSSDEGMALLSLPDNSTAIKQRHFFTYFVVADGTAMVLSMCAVGIYFLAALPTKNKKALMASLIYGYCLTMFAMVAMVIAFVTGLLAVLPRSSMASNAIKFIVLPAFLLLFFLLRWVYNECQSQAEAEAEARAVAPVGPGPGPEAPAGAGI